MGYLNEVFNTYHKTNDLKKRENIKKGFKNIIWSCLPYTKLDRSFKFKISYNNIKNEKILNLFEKYNYMEYKVLRSRYNINTLEKEDLIKARINSNYGKYFDKEVYLNKEYYRSLANYKNLYFQYLNKEISDQELYELIKHTDDEVQYYKDISLKYKYDMSWKKYKLFINMCFDKIFDNYKLIEEKVKNNEFTPNHILDWDEDNYILGYVNKSLNGYLKNYTNEIKGIRKEKKYKQCEKCGILIEKKSNKTKYCDVCKKEILQKQKNKWKREKWNKSNKEEK